MAVPWLLIAVLGIAVNVVSCQTPFGDPPPLPTEGVRLYLGVLNTTIPNYAMIPARDFADRDAGAGSGGSGDGINDGVWCQSAMNVSGIGSWKLPNGSVASDNLTVTPIHMANRPGQVGLLRSTGIGNPPYQGMYTCTIPDENGVNQTLAVWAAGNAAYDGGTDSNPTPNPLIESATVFNLLNQSKDTDPPEFTLSFSVLVAPPTYVTCYVDGTLVEVAVLSREVTVGLYSPPGTASPVTIVIVTLRIRLAGNYYCKISVERTNVVDSTTTLTVATSSSVFVTVTNTPQDFDAPRYGLKKAFTSWTAPANDTPPVEGYEVFYESESGVRTSGGNTTATQTNLTLSSLEPNVSYTAFVVACGGDLPSAHSNYATIPAVVSINLTTNGDSVAGSDFSITATINISEVVGVQSFNFTWLDSSGNEQNATLEGIGSGMSELMPTGPVVYTIELTFSSLRLSQAGLYTLWITIVDIYGIEVTLHRSYLLIIQIEPLIIAVSDTTVGTVPGRYFTSAPFSLTCSINVPEAVDVDNFTITEFWSGPDGPISSDDPNDSYIITPAAMQAGDSNTYISTLTIASLDSTGPDGDSGNYSCNMTLTLTGDYPNILPPTVSDVDMFELIVEDPTPELKIVSNGSPQTGNTYSLVCNVTADKDLLSGLSVDWFIDGNEVMNTTNRTISLKTGTSFITATLKFDPVAVEDEGNYTCNSTLTIPGSTEPPLTVNDTTSVGTIGDPEVSIMDMGSRVAGEQYFLVCVVTVVGALPTASWQRDGGNVINGVTSSGEGTNTVTLTLEFNPLTYEDGGIYTCVGFSAVSNQNTNSLSFPVYVQVPEPEVKVATNSNDTLYQATQQSLYCSVAFSNLLPPDGITVHFQWYFQETMIENGARVTVSNLNITLDPNSTLASSSITFSPINTTDSGNYECLVGFSLVGSPATILPPGDQQKSVNVTVEAFPVPSVVITTVGGNTAGNNFTLTCAAENLIDNLVDTPELQWVGTGISSSSMNTLDFSFNPLRTSDGGVFMCQWTFTTLGLSFSDQTSFSLAVNIPIIAVSVQTLPSEIDEGDLSQDTFVDLICDPSITEAVDTAVNISFTWTARGSNGMSIDIRGDGYTITDQFDNSTLRIERLNIIRDNMAVYSCSVDVTPISGSAYIIGSNSNMGNITLTVNELEVDIVISIPGIPTAGDNFTITCIVTGPERLAVTPQIDWEVEINGMGGEPVTDADIGFVTTGEIVISGSGNFSRTLTFPTISTSQARRFLCNAFISGSISESAFADVHVQISPPIVTVRVDPAVNPIYSSTAINLTCTAVLAEEVDTATMAMATWTGPNKGSPNNIICQQPSDSRICVVEAVSVEERMFESILVFYPVDIEEDTGVHTCDMTINSNTMLAEGTFVEMTSSNGNISLVVEELPGEIPIVSVTASGSTEVGQSLNLSCDVTLVERTVVSPGVDYNITWMKMDSVSQGVIGKDISITTVTEMGDPTTTVTLTFDPLRFEDRGTYICMADLNVTRTLEGGEGSEELDAVVDFPPVAVEVSMDYEDPLFAGTNLTLTCSTDLDENLVDIPVVLSTSWTRNSAPVIIDSTHSEEQPSPLDPPLLLTYAATYSFTPLDDRFNSTDSSDVGSAANGDMGNTDSSDMGDSGAYQCDFTVMADVSDSFVRPRNGSNTSNDITVLALPPPTVDIVVDGINIPGQALSLTCVVGVVDRLVVQPVIVWEKYANSESVSANTISVNSSRNGNNSTLSFLSLRTSDAGLYTCTAILTIDSINVNVTAEDTQNITLQIPTPQLVLSQSRAGAVQLAGSSLTFIIDISVEDYVDTPHIVFVNWTRDETILASGGRITVSDVSNTSNSNQYQAQIAFDTLSSTIDSGMYTSTVSVNGVSSYPYVINALPTTDMVNISVTDPSLTEFAEGLENFEGVETGCIHSDLFDDVTLICNVSKPEEVIPQLTVTWLHNGTVEVSGVTQVLNGGATVTRTLRFNSSVADDSGNYTCVAELVIPESTTITQSTSIEITFRSSRPPFTPTQVENTTTTTTANISWTVPAIAYTPENYTVTYRGLELQPETRESALVVGDPTNILATDRIYFVLLEGLEEANTYSYTVNAINCEGNTSTDVMSFTTMPDIPSGTPQNCINSTFNARNVGLQWQEPMRVLQNGQIQGYNLTCSYMYDDPCASFLADLNPTQSSSNTIFTIDPVSPFTQYTCSLSAVNEVGEGPPTQCIFTTQQDAPEGPPENLASDRRIDSVTFEWMPPSCPNGIIQRYLFFITTDNGTYNRELCANQTTMTVDGFNPYELYSVEVFASTRVNGTFLDGPPAMREQRTLPDRSSPVRDLSVTRINSSSLYISFTSPLAPNGVIDNYIVNVNNLVEGLPNSTLIVSNTSATEQFSATPIGLSPCVPYYIIVYAENQVGRGLETQGVNFTEPCEPEVSPKNVRVTVTVDLSVTVSWDPVSLEDAQGFFMYRIIFELVTASTARRNSRQSDSPMDFFVDVPSNLTNVTVTSEHGYDPNSVYTVSVGLAVDDGTGTIFQDFPTSLPQDLDALITPTPSPPEDGTLIIIIACVVAAVFAVIVALVVIIFIICMLWRKKSHKTGGISLESNGRRKRKKDLFDTGLELSPVTLKPMDEPPVLLRPPEETAVSEPKDQQEDEEESKQDLAAVTERRMDEELMLERMKPITKICFHEHVTKMHVDSDKGFEEEYKSVPMETDSTSDVGHLDMNKVKNRFANIFPYDFSRIRLKQIEDVPGSDYINACYVDGYNRTECYIAAQGPLPTTVGDFWRMIWESRVTNVVMLTGVVEAGKKKCEQYWPDKVGEALTTQNGLSVMLASSVPFSDYSIRSLRVTKPGQEGAKALDVSHYHFTAWPDHGVPQFATSLISFIRRVQKGHDKDKGIPLLVHCSAGVGRTGTFILLDSMMDRLKVEDTVNVYEFLRNLRAKRMHMIQTQVQYVFIHDALDELITCGETDILASNLRAKVNRMNKIVPGKNITGFQEQFQLLEQVCYKPSDPAFSDALQQYNSSKNRYEDKLPLNLTRPRLRPTGASGSDYINASFVDGYKMRNAYISTQGPLKSTVEDFWRMVWEFKSRNIVMLCRNVEEGEEKCYMFWPTKENEPVEYGKLKVTLQAHIPGDEFITRKLHICNDKGTKVDKEGVVVTLFQYMTWSEHSHPSSSAHMIELVETLTRAQMNTGNRPITVMCNDGVGRSGAFICIHSQLDRLKTDGDVDVFKYLKTARTRRQGLVIELDHYVYCHEVLADYVEAFDPYANFKNL